MATVVRLCICMLFPALLSHTCKCQILDGNWEGKFERTPFMSRQPYVLKVEIISNNDSTFTGSSHWLYEGGKYEHYKIMGKYNAKDSIAIFEESLIETNFKKILESTYKMKLKKQGNHVLLQGNWKEKNKWSRYYGINKVWLQKNGSIVQPGADFTLPATNPASLIEKRVVDIQKIVEITNAEKDSIEITIYDNGDIDGDSVSVYLNDSLLVNNHMISDKPLLFYVSLNRLIKFNKIKMVAQNLGSIPPNTALMIIKTIKDRYEIRLASDLDKTAAIEFIFTE